ncbi:MAG: hypothetical protein MZV70_07745 [Desulfobacterales bacterium]|nr:hypothetical protein [Desulfobacterales bacterium]
MAVSGTQRTCADERRHRLESGQPRAGLGIAMDGHRRVPPPVPGRDRVPRSPSRR